MSTEKLKQQFTKPIVTGLIAMGAEMILFGGGFKTDINFLNLGLRVSSAVGVGIASATGSFIGETGKQWVLPYIPGNKGYVGMEGMLVEPILSGIATSVLLYPNLDGSKEAFAKSFAIGAGSNIGADYSYRTFLSK